MRVVVWILTLLMVCAGAPAARAGGETKPAKNGNEAKLGRARIAGVSVSGLTPHQARARLARALRPKLNTRIALTDGKRTVARTRRQLGLGLDVAGMVASAKAGRRVVPLRLTADPAAVQRALRSTAGRFTSPPRNARVVASGGRVRIDPAAHSRRLDVGKTAHGLARAVRKNAGLRSFRVTLVKKPPRVSAADLKGINSRLATFTTRFNPGAAKRAHNIRLAIRSIHGTILRPGQVFSLNDAVGERTQKRGYRTAPVFENRKKVPGIGGGVSQVTGTLFNAALLAGLPIEEYHTHAKPVPYIPVGRDATVAWQALDMKFRNNTSAPIYISYQASGSRLTATLYGARKPGRKVTVRVLSRKKGPRKMVAQLYRVFKENGKVVRKELVGRSDYNWKPEKPD